MKKNPHPPTIGSLDHFEDMADRLDDLGVAYMLVVGLPNTPDTHTWSNIAQFGREAIEEFCDTFDEAMGNQIVQLGEMEDEGDNTLN